MNERAALFLLLLLTLLTTLYDRYRPLRAAGYRQPPVAGDPPLSTAVSSPVS